MEYTKLGYFQSAQVGVPVGFQHSAPVLDGSVGYHKIQVAEGFNAGLHHVLDCLPVRHVSLDSQPTLSHTGNVINHLSGLVGV